MKPRLISRKLRLLAATVFVVSLALSASAATAGSRSNVKMIEAHEAALAACDANTLVSDYTADATLFYPDGVIVHGRSALQSLYDEFVMPRSEGGLCGLKATPVRTWTRGSTSFAKFKVTAPFLAKVYFATDGFVFKGDKIAAEMSTFDASKLDFK
jgi:hypothetical protein